MALRLADSSRWGRERPHTPLRFAALRRRSVVAAAFAGAAMLGATPARADGETVLVWPVLLTQAQPTAPRTSVARLWMARLLGTEDIGAPAAPLSLRPFFSGLQGGGVVLRGSFPESAVARRSP